MLKSVMNNTVIGVSVTIVVFVAWSAVLAVDPPINLGPDGMITNGQTTAPGVTYTNDMTGKIGTIDTGTNAATVIDYDRFNVNHDWLIRFQQPDGGATLNRVGTGNPSNIFGKITSNGDVYIVNPAGVVFGAHSVIDVKKLVASGLWMETDDFLGGQMKFTARTGDQHKNGMVQVRAGSQITADETYLIGKDVINHGILQSAVPQTGYVVMVASTSGASILKDADTGDVFVNLTAPTGPGEPCGIPLGSGDIYSLAVLDAGVVAMTAQRDVVLHSDITSSGDITIEAGRLINFNSTNEVEGQRDQAVISTGGVVTLTGPAEKTTDGNLLLEGGMPEGLAVDIKDSVTTKAGNITIHGAGDVQIGGDITAGYQPGSEPIPDGPPSRAGVKIVSDNGKIYTQEDGRADRVNVGIRGGSDQLAGLGVDLPSGDGEKAAIILISSQPLVLGPDGRLYATGTYYAQGSGGDAPAVDDRAAIDFRDSVIHQGDPIDVAIYLKSKGGDVKLDNLHLLLMGANFGTVVLDALNTVIIGNADIFDIPMYYLYRLEVCSRNTLRLQQAIDNGTLPLASDPGAMEVQMGGGTYVLRGGVQEDVDGSPLLGAWVLYDDVLPPPGPTVSAVTAVLPGAAKTPTDDGCPALIQAAAEEIGQDPAMFRTGTLVSMKNMQPCSTCERLMKSADILKDPEGKRLTALGQAINEFVTTDAPPSPEQMASVSQTLAMRAKEGASYAAAQEWVDALATYVGILRSEIGLSQADALAVATGKYGSPAKSNEAVKAFIAKKLADLAS